MSGLPGPLVESERRPSTLFAFLFRRVKFAVTADYFPCYREQGKSINRFDLRKKFSLSHDIRDAFVSKFPVFSL
jgi:hypothetical protein